MQTEISQRVAVTLKTTDEVIDLRKTKGATLEDILDPDAPDELEVENNSISPIHSFLACKYAVIENELKQEYGFLNPLEEYRDLQPIFNNGKRIYI